MFGDDGGSLTIIRFSQPPNSLFKKDEVDSVQTLFWSNMDKHADFATVQYNQVRSARDESNCVRCDHVRVSTVTGSMVSSTSLTTRRW